MQKLNPNNNIKSKKLELLRVENKIFNRPLVGSHLKTGTIIYFHKINTCTIININYLSFGYHEASYFVVATACNFHSNPIGM